MPDLLLLVILLIALLPIGTAVPNLLSILFAVAEVALMVALFRFRWRWRAVGGVIAGSLFVDVVVFSRLTLIGIARCLRC
jgi:hypothetical protein